MDIQNLIDIIDNNKIKSEFYKECIIRLKNIKNETDTLLLIPNNEYILEPIRLFLLENSDYNIYLSSNDTLKTNDIFNYCIRRLEFNDLNTCNNLLKQLNAIENLDLSTLCSKINNKCKTINVIITKANIDDEKIKIKNTYENISLLFGLNSIEILKHQNLDRLCDLINKNNIIVDKFNKLIKDLNKKSNSERDKYIIIDNSVLLPLGANLPDRMELISYNDINLIENKIDLVINPKYYFHFMGVKFLDINIYIKIKENNLNSCVDSHVDSIVDLLLLKIVNNYESKICFPNLTINENRAIIYTDSRINDELIKIKEKLKEYGFDFSIDELNKMIPKCRNMPFEIYAGEPIKDPITSAVTFYHNKTLKHYMFKYLKNTKLLDIGAGPLRQLQFYNSMGIKKLVAIEPSVDSINLGLEKYNTLKESSDFNLKLDFIEGFGDELWVSNKKYKPVFDNSPYDKILFKFTIHYMIDNLDILLKNIKSIDNKHSRIMITCLDGNKILEKLRKNNGRYEIYHNNSLIYGIYDFENSENTKNNRQMVVYFKGVYGVEMGSIEYIVDIDRLINGFKSIGYKLILKNNFAEIKDFHLKKIFNTFNESQKKISELHTMIILEKMI